MRTSDVKAALRRHYKPSEYALMFEVANGTGSNARRWADAVTVSLWPSRGLTIEGYEIKVSRSDWRRELDLPAKAEAVAAYCDKWWVVTPENIVHDHEMPPLWGHMVVHENGKIVIKKPAPKKDLVRDLDRHFLAAMLRRASDADAAEVEAAVKLKMVDVEKAFDERLQRAVDRKTAEGKQAIAKLEMIREAGIDIDRIYDAKEFAKQVRLAQKLGSFGSNLKYQIGSLKRAIEDLTAFGDLIEEGQTA